jgi:hypothetical protein
VHTLPLVHGPTMSNPASPNEPVAFLLSSSPSPSMRETDHLSSSINFEDSPVLSDAMLSRLIEGLSSYDRIILFATTTLSPDVQDTDIMFSELHDTAQDLAQQSGLPSGLNTYAIFSPALSVLVPRASQYLQDFPNLNSTLALPHHAPIRNMASDEVVYSALARILSFHISGLVDPITARSYHPCPLGLLCPFNCFPVSHHALTYAEYQRAITDCTTLSVFSAASENVVYIRSSLIRALTKSTSRFPASTATTGLRPNSGSSTSENS